MVILTIPNPNIPTTLGWVHEGTTWLLATSLDFDNDTVASKLESTIDLTSVTLDYNTMPDVTYYSKAIIYCNKGIIESDVDVITVKDFIKITNDYPIPSIVNIPTLTLDSSNNDFPSSLFTLNTPAISTTSNAEHLASSIMVETLTQEPVYSKLSSRDDLVSKKFDDVVLDDNMLYVISMSHESNSNDKSEFGKEVVLVKDAREINVSSNLLNHDIGNGFNVILDPINNFKSMRVELFATGMGDAKLVYAYSIAALTKVIPSNYFTDNRTDKFILKITVTRQNNTIIGPKFFKLTTL